MVELYLLHKDGVVQKHHVSKNRIDKVFYHMIDRSEIVPRCDCCGERVTHEVE